MLNSLIKISDCNNKDLKNIINLGIDFKNGKTSNSLSNKTAVLLFDKPSFMDINSFSLKRST